MVPGVLDVLSGACPRPPRLVVCPAACRAPTLPSTRRSWSSAAGSRSWRAIRPGAGTSASWSACATRSASRPPRSSATSPAGRRPWSPATRTGPTPSTTSSYLMEDWVEVHGDRAFADDPAIVAGFATFRGRSVAVIGHQKGRDTKERILRNFGQPRPEGYRKALRVMKLAERFGLPVLTFIDTAGAYPGPRRRGARPGRGHRPQPRWRWPCCGCRSWSPSPARAAAAARWRWASATACSSWSTPPTR